MAIKIIRIAIIAIKNWAIVRGKEVTADIIPKDAICKTLC
jgi:hypothetical protein